MGLCLWRFSRQEYWSGLPCPPPGNLPNPGIEPRPPELQADSLPSEPLGKPMSTGMGSLTILEEIFPTQELNRDLLHCRWILYQLRYQGSPLSIPIVNMLQISHACWLIATVSIHWSVIPLEPNPVSGLLLPH